MPLDDLKWATPEIEIETPLARRQRLIEALRSNPQPWDFRYCNKCAMGLAVRLGLAPRAHPVSVGRAIGISTVQAWRVFMTSLPYKQRFLHFFLRPGLSSEITAARVADALEQIGEPLRGE
jgi:hypothetical protein